jgi:topoisomerase IV subunit B
MAKNQNLNTYNEDSIDVLEGLDGVRKRPAMYIGSTNSIGLHHLVWEILDNAIDEALSGFGDTIYLTIHADGSLTIKDSGRGIPVGIQKQTGKPAIEIIFMTLHSGGKFSDKSYVSSAGLHGVGASVTNALSEYVDVTVSRDGFTYHIRFENGGKKVGKLEKGAKTNKTGTTVRFKPDPKVFTTTEFKWETIIAHLQESAFLMKKVRFIAKDERTNMEAEYYYEEGLKEYIASLNETKEKMHQVLVFEDLSSEIKIEISMQYCLQDYNESIYSYVNNIRTKDGGTHENGFRGGLTRAVNEYAETNGLLRSKVKLEGTDIREGLTAIVSLKIPEGKLEFEGQTKGKLGTPDALAAVQNMIYSKLTYYLVENKDFATNLIKKCVDSQAARMAARKAKEEARGNKKFRSDTLLSDKLTPAQSKDYLLNELFIVEGDSAGGTAKNGRDRLHQAILPLRGKPLNTDSLTMEQMLKNTEFATLIATISAGVGPSFDIQDAKYGKIIIMTDADTDGAHIQTLLLTFFYHHMRPLINAGKVYIAIPPLYRIMNEQKQNQFAYAWTEEELEKAKKVVGSPYRISRYKGLGEMNASQLKETTMDPQSRTLIRVNIEDPLIVERRVGILMGKDPSVRRKWVEENIDFTIREVAGKVTADGKKI